MVWFDQSELRGGDAWDIAIRKQIKTCALFMPIISRNTYVRDEGYFRLEWKLAVDRSHLMVTDRPFLVPVVIDDTSNQDEKVPERFREVQWTRLPGGVTSEVFVERVQRSGRAGVCSCKRTGAGFNPPPHSIAVLPFADMSEKKDQEYFSHGLTEEPLNSLTEINGPQVAARTSAFSFKGTNTDIDTIARKLNVGAMLEGSVRRSAHTIRITAQLINSVTGFRLWSKTYDRDLGDVMKLQTEIATSVASALKVTLLGDIATKVEFGGTGHPAAFDAYLHGAKAFGSMRDS